MKDIFKKYKKNKRNSLASIIVTSLILAIWINFFVIDNSWIWKNLRTSVLDAKSNINKSDIYLSENEKWEIEVKASKNMLNVASISFSINYNPENIKIEGINSQNAKVLDLSNTPWINSVNISFDDFTNIKWWDTIAKLNTQKINNKIENINVSSAKFTDSSLSDYQLTTSWTSF